MSKFYGHLNGTDYDQPALFEAAAKAQGRRKLSLPRMRGGWWRTPTGKAFTPEGITPGAEVRCSGRNMKTGEYVHGIYGQVWVRADYKLAGMRHWWIVDADGAPILADDRQITVLSQCGSEQLSIEGVA